MARPRRQIPQFAIARRYLEQHLPELRNAPLRMRQLDGPPGSPRFAVTAELCTAKQICPHGVSREDSLAGRCEVAHCALRKTVRLLIDRSGEVVQVTRSDLHWS
ncbi:MAG: hypothetical protein Fur005_14450 [Roseiflexaceae bacterium]